MAWERRHPCLHDSIYRGQDGRAPGYIFIIVCERQLMITALKITPGSAGIPACFVGQTGIDGGITNYVTMLDRSLNILSSRIRDPS